MAFGLNILCLSLVEDFIGHGLVTRLAVRWQLVEHSSCEPVKVHSAYEMVVGVVDRLNHGQMVVLVTKFQCTEAHQAHSIVVFDESLIECFVRKKLILL